MKKWTWSVFGAAVALTLSPALFAQSNSSQAPRNDPGMNATPSSPATETTPGRTGSGMQRTPDA
jgi:hypothetical protein